MKSNILYNDVVLPSPVGAAINVILFLLLILLSRSSGVPGYPKSNILCIELFFFNNLNTNFSPYTFLVKIHGYYNHHITKFYPFL